MLTLPNRSALRRHVTTHSLYQCSTCLKSFGTRRTLTQHHAAVHLLQFRFHCPRCDFANNNQYYMNVHIAKHTTEATHVCSICGKNVYDKYALKRHITYVHGTGFRCDLCRRSYHSKAYLERHRQTRHPVISAHVAYQCEICGDTFADRHPFVQHSATHATVTVFKCGKCDKHVRSRASLRKHLLLHDGVRNFLCDECGKGFVDKQALRLHLRTHTERPFVCTDCGRRFTQRTSLRAHRKRHSRN